ncbi:MAG: phosphogluconate dehydrogenase (NAD(+)-dependent, decarboxylating) [Iamia sp.]
MKLAMVGLGKMGSNMTERLRRAGHEVVGYDPHADGSDVASLAEAVEALGDGPRVVWSMVPSGDITEATVTELGQLLSDGDVVVDGGNSNFRDSLRRAEALAASGVGWVDAGTSGGVWGLENGYALMVGGTDDDVAKVWPALEALSPGDGNGLAHVGPPGSGHFTKMVHNGVEYGMMQAYAEGFAILDASELDIDITAGFRSWQHGSVVRSWLLDLLVRALEQDPGLEGIAPVAADSGEGRWTVEEAIHTGVAAPVISAALFARFVSQDDDVVSMRAIAALRNQFGGHAVQHSDGSGAA